MRIGVPAEQPRRHSEVAEFYAARAGRDVDDVMPDDAAKSDAWTAATLSTIAQRVVLCERVFSVLYAAAAEYLGNYCRNEMAGTDINVDMWLAEYSGIVWEFPTRTKDGEWFVSVTEVVHDGIDAVVDTLPPIEAYPIKVHDRGWYTGNKGFTPDALMYKDAVDHLVVRAGEMIGQLHNDGVLI